MLHRLRNRAMDNWLGSQFAERAPGLRALQRRAFNAVDPRRVEAVADQDPAGAITDLFISPDTRYASHIVEI